ncbi:histidine kinase [Chitinophaga silvatica]|uniref:histidine kinase n=1 Tax=Chitinophaga silvatica TaxID=2282649 RepID=A0A3E1Y4R6_9BACT|nr:two-component regulator propeller domain-containing protein [Chitinophaga silvatica]RFS19636.1 histidine kinase [Chitinophaga silvatica]
MRKLGLAILSFLLLLTHKLYSQSENVVHYQVENGLSHNAVICALQDRQGFMWFGTLHGLNRFDGYTFHAYLRSDHPDSLGNNNIICLFEGKNGLIYVGTEAGAYIYTTVTEKFKLLSPIIKGDVHSFTEDKKGNIWLTSSGEIFRYNPATDQVVKIKGFSNAVSLCLGGDDNIWVISNDGYIAVYNASTQSFTQYSLFSHSKPASAHWVQKIVPQGKDSLWICTPKQGIKLFNIRARKYQDYFSNDQDGNEIYARDILRKSDGEYWIATESGIYLLDINNNTIINLKKKYHTPYSISDNAVYCLLRDKEGGIWAGTYFGGVNYFPVEYISFEKFFPQSGIPSLSGNAVREIHPDQYGNLWIGTEDGGINSYTPKTGIFKNIQPGSGLSHTNIHGVLVSGDSLWIGTFEHGLDVMNIRTGKFVKHYEGGAGEHQLKSNFIYYILQTKNKDIYCCTSFGAYKYNREADNFDPVAGLPINQFYVAATEDSKGNLWFGTSKEGVFYLNPKTSDRKVFSHSSTDNTSLANNRVNHIFEDSQHRIWLGTEDGLCLFHPATNNFTRYGSQQGFNSTMIFRIEEDNNQQLWISTAKGLACFNPAIGTATVFTKDNGLLNDQFNYSSSYRDSSNIYFGSVKGMIRFNPSLFKENNFRPPVYITGLQIYGKEAGIGEILQKSISVTDSIILAHDQSSFSIDFAALSYTSPEMTAYAYKMQGLDAEWTYLSTNRKAYFTKLAPGVYHFMVKAANSSGKWSETPRVLYIKILPPFYLSYPAYALYLLLLTALIYSIVRWYHQRAILRQKREMERLAHEKEKEVYQAKIEFFTHIAHEIRTPLTLIKGPMEKVIKRVEEVPQIQKNLRIMERNTDRLLDLTTQLLDFRRTETHGFSLSFTHTNITELLREIFLRFTPAAEQKNIDFQIQLPDADFYANVDAEAMNKIIGNLLNNAIKYASTQASLHLLQIRERDTTFEVLVKNDGYLLPGEVAEKIFEPFFRLKATASESGAGIGLSLSKTLTELHNGKLVLVTPVETLNVFSLTLPINPDTADNSNKWTTNH